MFLIQYICPRGSFQACRTFFEKFENCLSLLSPSAGGNPPSRQNEQLSSILDESEGAGAGGDLVQRLGTELESEHAARVRAEAEAVNHERRLVIAQEQFSEYAVQREEDLRQLLTLLQKAEGMVGGALEKPGGNMKEMPACLRLDPLYA